MKTTSSRPYGHLLSKFDALKVGQTFTIPVVEQTCSWAAFKVTLSRHNVKLAPRRFHSRRNWDGSFEVYRSE